MKSKLLISLLLAVVMLVTLATPALAAKPEKGHLMRQSGEPSGYGKYSFQATHNNDLKFTVVIRDATPNKDYRLYVWHSSTPNPYPDGDAYSVANVTTDDRGNLRYTGILPDPGAFFGSEYFVMQVRRDPYAYNSHAFIGYAENIFFKP